MEKLDLESSDAIDKINQWVSERTKGRITSIMEPGSKPSLVAVNAFYFKDCWRFPFNPAATSSQTFHLLNGTDVNRAMMRIDNESFGFAHRGRFVAVELPYSDGRFALSIITTTDRSARPDAFSNVSDLLMGAGLKITEIDLSVPKFVATDNHDLLRILAKLGLADGLASSTQLAGFGNGLSLSALQQKTFISVDEAGTEAAAATAATATRAATPQPMKVKIDRPFMYALRHRASGSILMTGYVADPMSESDNTTEKKP
jgi:serpin B